MKYQIKFIEWWMSDLHDPEIGYSITPWVKSLDSTETVRYWILCPVLEDETGKLFPVWENPYRSRQIKGHSDIGFKEKMESAKDWFLKYLYFQPDR